MIIDDMGAFHWGPVGTKDTRPGFTIPLSDLCDVRTGKRTDALSLPIASRYGEELCYSVHSSSSELSVIATSKEVRSSQLKAFGRLLVAADRGPKSRPLSIPSRPNIHYSLPVESLPAAAAAAAVAAATSTVASSPTNIPASVVEVKNPTPLSPVAAPIEALPTNAAPLASSTATAPTVVPLDATVVASSVLRGAEFVSYIEPVGEPRLDDDGKRRWADDAYRGEDLFVWLEPPPNGDTSKGNSKGVLCWVPTKDNRNKNNAKTQPLLLLSDVGLSKFPLKVHYHNFIHHLHFMP
jgi:hypothetical protein